jgi:hypothetical protein
MAFDGAGAPKAVSAYAADLMPTMMSGGVSATIERRTS